MRSSDLRALLSDAERKNGWQVAEAKAAKNGDKFAKLWGGEWDGYGSHSEGDPALSACSRSGRAVTPTARTACSAGPG